MSRPMKITPPTLKGGKKGRYTPQKVNKEWMWGRRGPSGQKPQSPIRTWAEMTEEQRAELLNRLANKP